MSHYNVLLIISIHSHCCYNNVAHVYGRVEREKINDNKKESQHVALMYRK